MLNSIQVLFFITIWTSAVYWTLPSNRARLRQSTVLLSSAILIYVFNPRALLLVVLITLFAYCIFKIGLRFRNRSFVPWLVVLPLIIDKFTPLIDLLPIPVGSPRSPVLVHLATLGLSFYTLKLYGSIKIGLKSGTMPFMDLISTTLFFPSFSMGPIDYVSAFSSQVFSRDFDWIRYLRGLLRIGVGIVKVFVISIWITSGLSEFVFGQELSSLNADYWSQASTYHALGFAYIAFLNLYMNFSGFTDIAIGSAWLFNIDLSENFKSPLRAHTIQNFWQRWHLSLANFITRYLFKPILRATGRPFASIIVTFVLVGLWHKVSFGYLIWGIGHGIALGVYAKYGSERRSQTPNWNEPKYLLGIIGTLTLVSILSAIANQANETELILYLRALAPLV